MHRGLPSAEPLSGREVIAGVEVDHEPVGRDQRLLLQAPPLLPRLDAFDRVAVADDVTALEHVVRGVAQVAGQARQLDVVAVALEIGQAEDLQAEGVHHHISGAAFHPEQPHVHQPHQRRAGR